VYEKVTAFYKHAFLALETVGHLNRDNLVHIGAIVAFFLPRLQSSIDRWIKVWNLHKMRKITGSRRNLAAHIPAARFQEYERERG
jgi:hypothetical protein